MEEKEKYYTPTIEEFHVGFVCEMGINGNWSKCVIEQGEEDWGSGISRVLMARSEFGDGCNIFSTHQYDYRVKYLDKEDIESLEFKYAGNDMFDILDYKDVRGFYNTVHLIIRGQWVLISLGIKNTDVNSFATIFAGSIKNKSEFKKIIKQVGILEDEK